MQEAHSSSGGGDPRGILGFFGPQISPSSGESVEQPEDYHHCKITYTSWTICRENWKQTILVATTEMLIACTVRW